MGDLRCYSVLGHDGAVHAFDRNGYCACGMGRKQLLNNQDIRDIYGNWPVSCLLCIANPPDRPYSISLHYELP